MRIPTFGVLILAFLLALAGPLAAQSYQHGEMTPSKLIVGPGGVTSHGGFTASTGTVTVATVVATVTFTPPTGAITSAMVLDGTLVNADVNAAAALAHSKLAAATAGYVLLGNASNVPTATSVTGDVSIGATGVTTIGSGKVTSAMVVNDTLVDADVNSAAAIAHSKLAAATAGYVLLGNSSNVPTATSVTGDVGIGATGVTTIGAQKVVSEMIAPSAFGQTTAKIAAGDDNRFPTSAEKTWGTTNMADGQRSVTLSQRQTLDGFVYGVAVWTSGQPECTITFDSAYGSADFNLFFSLEADAATDITTTATLKGGSKTVNGCTLQVPTGYEPAATITATYLVLP